MNTVFCSPSYKAIDPLVTAVAGLTAGTGGGNGGGKTVGAGTYYSKATNIDGSALITDMITLTGTLAGTATYEVSNSTRQDIINGLDKWSAYNPIATITLSAVGTHDNVELLEMGFSYVRAKIVISAGAGDLGVFRTVKVGE